MLDRETGHVLVTIAAAGDASPALAAPGIRQVLVGGAAGDGYDVVVADPDRLAAQRFGLRRGGRVMVRPDGYVGFVTGLDDTGTAAEYAALLGRN